MTASFRTPTARAHGTVRFITEDAEVSEHAEAARKLAADDIVAFARCPTPGLIAGMNGIQANASSSPATVLAGEWFGPSRRT